MHPSLLPLTPETVLMLLLLHIHVFVSLAALLGLALFYQWAVRSLSHAHLLRLSLWLLVGGGIAVLLTVSFCLLGMRLLAG